MEELHGDVIRKYHTLCHYLGLTDDEKKAILGTYGVQSSKDMNTHDLLDVCAGLQEQLNSRTGAGEVDRLRKRAIACIGSYLRQMGESDGMIK